jgi:YidC/Oxa1 family membrane protein insertase
VERRFLLALILAGAVMFLWNVVFFPPPPPEEKPAVTQEQTDKAGKTEDAVQGDSFGSDPFGQPETVKRPDMLPPVEEQLARKLEDDNRAPNEEAAKLMPEVITPVTEEKKIAETDLSRKPDSKSPEMAVPAEANTEKAQPAAVIAEPAPVPTPAPVPVEELVKLETPDFVATFTSFGARLKSFVLKGAKYSHKTKEGHGRFQLDIVTVRKAEHYPFTLMLEGANFEYASDQACAVSEKGATAISFSCETPQGVTVTKTFELDHNYLLKMNIVVENKANGVAVFEPRIGLAGFQDDTGLQQGFLGSAPLNQQIPKAYIKDEKLWEETDREELEDGVIKRGQIIWTGIDDRYFLLSLLPPDGVRSQIAVKAVTDTYKNPKGDETQRHLLTIIHAMPRQEVQPAESLTLGYQAYVGPKEYTTLTKGGHNLEESIDFWILGFLGKPMLWVMKYSFQVIPNWGIAIIILTIIIKLLLYPLTRKSYLSMAKMKDLKPKLDKLKEQTGDDKAAFNQKMMELYKKEGVNPLGGCLPMLLQLPVFIALYRMLMNSVELYNAPFIPGWLNDLVMPDPYYILPVLLAVLMFVQQKITPTPDSQQQKMMLYMMPAMMFFFMLMLPSGLVLYILANTVVSIGQTWWIQKHHTQTPVKAKA